MSPALKPCPDDLTIIGLLGGVGCGKSTVAREMERLGAFVIDADRIAGEIMVRPDVLAEIGRQIGPAVLDSNGQVNRAHLAKLAFDDDRIRLALNHIVHPRVRSRIREHLSAACRRDPPPVVVFDIPLLLESELDVLVTCHVYVDTPESCRRERLVAQRGWDPAEMDRREAAQTPMPEKRKRADHVISNRGGPEKLRREVERLWGRLTRKGDTPTPDRPNHRGRPDSSTPTR